MNFVWPCPRNLPETAKTTVPSLSNQGEVDVLEVHTEVSMPDKVAQGVEEGAVVRIATVARL